jgi:hypothetical protein
MNCFLFVNVYRTKKPYWRWQLDLIDYQKFSTKEIDAKIAHLTKMEISKRMHIADQTAINKADPTKLVDPTLIWSHYKVLNDLRQKKEERQKLIDSGEKSEYRYIFSLKDHFTRYCWLRPLKTKSMEEVVSTLNEIFLIFHYPRILQTDNGKEFRNELMEVKIYI